MFRRAALALALLVTLPAVVTSPSVARADSVDVWSTPADAIKKRGQTGAFLVVFGKEDGAVFTKARDAFGDKRLAKAVEKGVVAIRLDAEDEAQARLFGLAVEKKEWIAVLDGYGVKVARHDKEAGPDVLAKLIKQGQDSTAKKKPLEKKLETAVTKAKALIEKSDTRTACEQLLAVAGYAEQLPCDAVEQAKERLAELEKQGIAVVDAARGSLRKNDWSATQKGITDATARFPLPEVQKQAAKLRDELAAEINRQSQK